MKRVHPDPQHVCIAEKKPLVVPQYSIVHFPADMIGLVLQYLRFTDAASISQTCIHFSKTIPKNEAVWSALFQNHFPNLPRFEPLLSWRTECELQRRCTRNIMTGVHSFHTIPVEQIDPGQNISTAEDADPEPGFCKKGVKYRYIKNSDQTLSIVADKPKPSCFAFDEGGSILIGYENGAIAILDPQTRENELLLVGIVSPKECHAIKSLICKDGLYIASSQRMVKAWAASTKKIIFSFESPDPLTSIDNLKFINGKLLVGQVFDQKTTVYIWDLRSNTLFTKLTLGGRSQDIILCGQTFVAGFKDNSIFIADLSTEWRDAKQFGEPFRIYENTEKSFFLYYEKTCTFVGYFLDEIMNSRNISLWTEPGISSGFKGLYEIDYSLCSLDELSQFFNKVVSEQFDHWNGKKQNEISNALPLRVSQDIPCVFSRGKIFYFSADKKHILCMDFTASHQVILKQLAQMLEEYDGILNYATKILERMPQPVQDEIKKNYSEIVLPSPPPQSLDYNAVLARTQKLTLAELQKLIADLKASSSFSDEKQLREAILKYLKEQQN